MDKNFTDFLLSVLMLQLQFIQIYNVLCEALVVIVIGAFPWIYNLCI